MHGRMQEDVAWTRLQDMQREMDNRRLTRGGADLSPAPTIQLLAERMWWLAGLAFQRAPRRHPQPALDRRGAVRDVA